jgi:ribosomal protein S18 acetylase RimI-like enzyme
MGTSLQRLGFDDAGAVEALLAEDPVQNVYLQSELRLHRMRGAVWWGVGHPRRLSAVLLGGALAVPWAPDLEDAGILARAFAEQAPPRMIVGPRQQVWALQQGRSPGAAPREVRDPQPVMVLERGELRVPASPDLRRGTAGDLDRLVVAAAAMHREEMGVDPLAVDPGSWRTRMTQLVERGWSFVWVEDGDIVFKTELSAWTPEAAQLQGVYTAPGRRRQGIATTGLAAVCEMLFATTPRCCLYVNHFNVTARHVYEHLGFRTVADYATLLF